MENNWPFPPGFKFCPTDKELLLQYLDKKIKNLPLPCDFVINDVRLYDYTPDHLAAKYNDNGQKEWYFFTVRERKFKGSKNKINRVLATRDGCWKASQTVDPVRDGGVIIGFKRNLAFFQGNKKTNWLMNEYFLETSQTCDADNNSGLQFDLALCKIYDKDHRKGGHRRAPLCRPCPVSAPPLQNPDVLSDNIHERYCSQPFASRPTHHSMYWSGAVPESSCPQSPASPSTHHSMYWSSAISESPCPQSPASAQSLQNSVVLSDNIPESYCTQPPALASRPTHNSMYWIPKSSCPQSPASPTTHHSMYWSSAISESPCSQSLASAPPLQNSDDLSDNIPESYCAQLPELASRPTHDSMYWSSAIPKSSCPQSPASPTTHHSMYWSSAMSESPCSQSLASAPPLQNSVVLSDNIPESYCPQPQASPPSPTHHSMYQSKAIPVSSCPQSPASASPRTHHSMYWSSAISESSCPQSPASAPPPTHHSMYWSSATPERDFPQPLASAPPPAHCSMYWGSAIPERSFPQHPASASPPDHKQVLEQPHPQTVPVLDEVFET